MCVIHTCLCACVLIHANARVHMWRPEDDASVVLNCFPIILFYFEMNFLTEPGTPFWLGRLSPHSRDSPSPLSRTGLADTCHRDWRKGVVIWTQVLMLGWQASYPLSHLPSPSAVTLRCQDYVLQAKKSSWRHLYVGWRPLIPTNCLLG